MLDDNTKKSVEKKFEEIKDEVKLVYFSKKGCETCPHIEELLDEIAGLSDKLKIEKYSFEKNADKVKEFGVENAPVIFFNGKKNISFFGIPSGYEFTAFLQDIVDVSNGEPQIAGDLKEKIKAIDFPVHFKVFVTPTCPYCSGAAKVAHDFAMLNDKIKGEVYEVMEFQELGGKYNVSGVPKTVINETIEMVGSYPPDAVLKKIMEAKK